MSGIKSPIKFADQKVVQSSYANWANLPLACGVQCEISIPTARRAARAWTTAKKTQMNPLPHDLVDAEMREWHACDISRQSLCMNRRSYPRIQNPFEVVIYGISAGEVPFEFHTRVDNLSFTGLYFRIPQLIKERSEVEVEVRFSDEGTAIQVKGEVLRAEPKPGMIYGVAVKVRKHKFLWK